MLKKLFILTFACLFFGCTHSKSDWNYDGLESSEHWAELDPKYKTCSEGHRQSPIALNSSDTQASKQQLLIDYLPTQAHMLNNGYTIEIDMDEENYIVVDDKRFKLLQLHFHADSEHSLEGVQFPAEMHLVHQAGDGQLAVLAMLINISETTQFDYIADKAPEPGEQKQIKLHLEKIIPENRERFVYKGSLTTPPCSENVLWMVFKKPLHVRLDQLQKFKAYYSHNYRPTQNTFEREVFLVKE